MQGVPICPRVGWAVALHGYMDLAWTYAHTSMYAQVHTCTYTHIHLNPWQLRNVVCVAIRTSFLNLGVSTVEQIAVF